MRSGRLRHRVTIQAPSSKAGAFGQPSRPEDYGDVETVWADVQPMGAKELEVAKAAEVRATHKVALRYFEGLDERHRFKLADGRVLEIASLRTFRELAWEHEALCMERRSG